MLILMLIQIAVKKFKKKTYFVASNQVITDSSVSKIYDYSEKNPTNILGSKHCLGE